MQHTVGVYQGESLAPRLDTINVPVSQAALQLHSSKQCRFPRIIILYHRSLSAVGILRAQPAQNYSIFRPFIMDNYDCKVVAGLDNGA